MFEPIQIEKIPEEKFDPRLIENYRVKHTDEVSPPDVVLFVSGQMVATRKNIFGITGKAKVGKTFLMTLINSVVLKKNELGVLSSYLPKGKDKILYIDTEQSEWHVSKVMQRINKLIESKRIENLLMYSFDAVPTSQRWQYTEWLICNNPEVGLVIIDGIADLVKSVNDEIIACDTADWMRRMATINDVAIGYVLHQNPSDSAKMRGHLGTVLMNKSETVIQISSSKENEAIKLVQTTQTRNKKPEDWSFEIIDGIPVIMDQCYTEPVAGRKKTKVLTDLEKYDLLLECYRYEKEIGYTVLTEKMRKNYIEKFGEIGINSIKEILKYCKEMNFLTQDRPKSGYVLQPHRFTV
jgi:uncharacterized protein YbaR (Trm112 family)